MRPSRTTIASMTLAAGITVLGTGTGLALASSSGPVEVDHPPMSVEVVETTEIVEVDGPALFDESVYDLETPLNEETPVFFDDCPPCGMG